MSGLLQSIRQTADGIVALFKGGAQFGLPIYKTAPWVPVGVLQTPGTSATTNAVGRLTQVGNLVHFTCYLEFAKGTGSGNLTITGLPNAAVNTTNLFHVSRAYIDGLASDIKVAARMDPNSAAINLVKLAANAAGFGAGDLAASATIIVSGSYRIS